MNYEKLWDQVVVIYFKVILSYLSPVSIIHILTMRTAHLSNTRHKFYLLIQISRVQF
jgi:hypothetical protein